VIVILPSKHLSTHISLDIRIKQDVTVTSNLLRAIHCSDKRRGDRMFTVRYDVCSNSPFSKCIVSLMCTFLSCSCARGQGRLNRTERTISHCSINRDLKRVIHNTRHNQLIHSASVAYYRSNTDLIQI
jgi:hypothetical protein